MLPNYYPMLPTWQWAEVPLLFLFKAYNAHHRTHWSGYTVLVAIIHGLYHSQCTSSSSSISSILFYIPFDSLPILYNRANKYNTTSLSHVHTDICHMEKKHTVVTWSHTLNFIPPQSVKYVNERTYSGHMAQNGTVKRHKIVLGCCLLLKGTLLVALRCQYPSSWPDLWWAGEDERSVSPFPPSRFSRLSGPGTCACDQSMNIIITTSC